MIGVYEDSSNTYAGSDSTGIRINDNAVGTEINHNIIGYHGFSGIHLGNVDSIFIKDNFIGVWRDTSFNIANDE